MIRSHRVPSIATRVSIGAAWVGLVASAGFAACVPSAPRGASSGSTAAAAAAAEEADGPLPPVRDFAPTTPAATHYNAPPEPAPQTSLGTAIAAAIAETPRLPGVALPLADARLFRACAELAQLVPEEGVIAYQVVELVLHRHGIIEPSPHLLVVWGALGATQEIVEQLRPRLDGMLAQAPARFGIGAAARRRDGSGAVVFALHASRARTAPIPRALPAEARFRLEASLEPPYREPKVSMLRDDGRVQRLPVSPGAETGAISAELSCVGRRGKQQIELDARYGEDTAVLASFPVWCGEQPPVVFRLQDPAELLPISSAGQVEQQLLDRINQERLALGLPALLWDEPVAAAARTYSAEMRATKRVQGYSPLSGSAAARLHAAGISRGVVLQNVARVYGIEEAHAGSMNLPSTRASAISPQATHIGIGVVLGEVVSGRPELFVTQVLTRVNPPIDPRAVATAVHTRLAASRALPRAAALDRVAQGIAEDLASGKSHESARARSSAAVKTLSKSYARVGSVITAFNDATTDDLGEISNERGDEVGVGVAQGPHPRLGDGATWIVLLYGHRKK